MGFQERVDAHKSNLQKQAQNMEFMKDFKGNANNQFSSIGINAPFKDISYGDGYAYKPWFDESGNPDYSAMDERYLPQELIGGGYDFGDIKNDSPFDLMRSGIMPSVMPGGDNQVELQRRLDEFKNLYQGMAPFGGWEDRPTVNQQIDKKTTEIRDKYGLAIPFNVYTPKDQARSEYEKGLY